MTTEHNPSVNVHVASGDEALEIVNRCRANVDERFEVQPLEDEFLSFAERLGTTGLYLVEADNNVTGTFKWRGASVATEMLYHAGKRWMVAYSAGNHSLGATAAVREYPDMFLDVFIPDSAPQIKKDGPRELLPSPQLNVHIGGEDLRGAQKHAKKFLVDHPESALLRPFNDRNVIRGQGTIADDILANLPDVDVIVAPTGGGGLAAGILQQLEERGQSHVQYYGIEAAGSNSMSRSLKKGKITSAENPNPLFGGVGVKKIGRHVFEICRRMTNFHILTVTDQEVDDLTYEYLGDYDAREIKSAPKEPTTLLGVAALRQIVALHPGAVIAVVSTGHNASPARHQPHTQPTNVWSSPFPK